MRRYVHDHPCVDCGEPDWRVLEFDHRNRTMKQAAVSNLITQGASIERIQQEIAHCDVRCANCHRRRTITQLGWYK